jgi:hypothetical protein
MQRNWNNHRSNYNLNSDKKARPAPMAANMWVCFSWSLHSPTAGHGKKTPKGASNYNSATRMHTTTIAFPQGPGSKPSSLTREGGTGDVYHLPIFKLLKSFKLQ